MKLKNNKTMIVMLLLGVFLIGIITAQELAQRRDTSIDVNESVKTTLATRGIIDPSTKDNGCDDQWCYFEINQDLSRNITLSNGSIIWKNETYHLGKQKIPRRTCVTPEYVNDSVVGCITYTDYTDEQLETMQDQKIKQVLEEHAENLDYRDSRIEKERIKILDDADVVIDNGGR